MPRKVLIDIGRPDETTLGDIEDVLGDMDVDITALLENSVDIENALTGIGGGVAENGLMLKKLSDIHEELQQMR